MLRFHACPCKERGQGYPDIANSLGGEWLVTSCQAAGFVVGAQPGEVGAQVL